MATSTIGISYTREDQPETIVGTAMEVSDAGRLEGPGRRTIPMGAGSTEYALWTGTNDANGSAFTAAAWQRMVLVVDPDSLLGEDDPDGELGVWVKLYYTAIAGGSSTATGHVWFVRRGAPFVIPSGIAASGVTITREITKVSVFNANASDDVVVQLIVEVPA